MILSWQWLSQLVDLTGTDPEDVAARLNARGLEVEVLHVVNPVFDKIYTARLEHIEKHPNSDHLHLVDVDLGDRKAHVVCGAPGIQQGWVVPFADIGAQFPDFKIKKSKIRGEESFGMLCSEIELGLGSDNGTLLTFPENTKLGMPIAEALDAPKSVAAFHDTSFEIGLTPDRGDCLSQKGLAREIAAALGRKRRGVETLSFKDKATQDNLVEVENGTDCRRYIGIIVDNVKVGKSPAWLRRAVEISGARSVNSAVDITNFVCFELGHPMHVFDCDKMAEPKIRVRFAKDGEDFQAINHEKYKLCAEDVVIASGNRAEALAGVMGGELSEVSEETTSLFIEIAAFSPSKVRKSAKRYALHSESSHRFERFVPESSVEEAACRALYLLQACQDEALKIRSYQDHYPVKAEEKKLQISAAECERHIGVKLTVEEIAGFLSAIDFDTTIDGSVVRVVVPEFRSDVERTIDLIEEIAKAYGVDNIPAALPKVELNFAPRLREKAINKTPYPLEATLQSHRVRQRRIAMRNFLIDSGLRECMHYTFAEPDEIVKLGYAEDAPENRMMLISNPLSVEQSAMRTMLTPSVLRALKRNLSRQEENFNAFELGAVFKKVKHNEIDILDESESLCLAMYGNTPSLWNRKKRATDVYDLKGVIEALSEKLSLDLRFVHCDHVPYLHPNIQIGIEFQGKIVGHMGKLHPSVAQAHKIPGDLFIAEISVSEWLALDVKTRFSHIPRLPKSSRDMALVLPNDVTFEKIARVIENERSPIVVGWDLFDIYRGPQVAEGCQSVALSFTYRDPEDSRTLTDDEIRTTHEKLRQALEQALGAVLR